VCLLSVVLTDFRFVALRIEMYYCLKFKSTFRFLPLTIIIPNSSLILSSKTNFIFLLSFLTRLCFSQVPSNVQGFQKGQNIRIEYSLQTTSPVEIKIEVSTDNGKTFSAPLKQVSGDVGKGITAGQKQIVWRVLEEVPELVGDGVVFRVSVVSNEWRPGTVHCGTPTEIVTVYNPKTGKTWMDRNLGASRVASSPTDEAAYGDLYQWGRFADGHQCRNSITTSTLSTTNTPGHGSFIITSGVNYDWRSPQKNKLWQGGNGINNPCPIGFRLPTDAEWDAERASWTRNNSIGAFASPLKLLMGIYRGIDGSLSSVGSDVNFWSASVSGSLASCLSFNSTNAYLFTNNRGLGFSVRCIKD